jgi:hypothetical protein
MSSTKLYSNRTKNAETNGKISFMLLSEVQSILNQFSQNSQLLTSTKCRFSVLILTQQTDKKCTTYNFHLVMKLPDHVYVFVETYTCHTYWYAYRLYCLLC